MVYAAGAMQPSFGATEGALARVGRAWPALRALLIFAHILAVIVLSLPSPHRLADKNVWRSRVHVDEIAAWAEIARSVGLELGATEFEDFLFKLTLDYLDLRARFIGPFYVYSRYSGLSQGWRMFTNPQRHPAQLHVELRTAASPYRPLFVQRSAAHAWRAYQFDHNRMRKQLGRFARSVSRYNYDHLAHWIARQVAAEFPKATHVRVRLFRFTSPTPAQVAEHIPVEGQFNDEREFELAGLR